MRALYVFKGAVWLPQQNGRHLTSGCSTPLCRGNVNTCGSLWSPRTSRVAWRKRRCGGIARRMVHPVVCQWTCW